MRQFYGLILLKSYYDDNVTTTVKGGMKMRQSKRNLYKISQEIYESLSVMVILYK